MVAVTSRSGPRARLIVIVVVTSIIIVLLFAAALLFDPDATSLPRVVNRPSQTPFNGPHALPGRVEAEDYDNGGANVAYSDTTPENTGGAGRLNEAVDVRIIDGVSDIAYISPGEWTEYTVDVNATARYTANFRLAAIADGRHVALTVDGAPGCTVTAPNTGQYQNYQTVAAPLTLTQGSHVIRLTYITGFVSIDWFEIVGGIPTTVPTIVPGTFSPPPVSAEEQARLTAAKAAGNARLASMRAAYSAWSIPSRPDLVAAATNVQTAGLAADGTTDTTAALQALLNAKPAGATIYFPAGTYRIDGPVDITKPVTLVGEKGTVFNCQKATRNVFIINKAGSLSSKMSGVAVTGVVIEGPGVETDPAMIDGYYLQNLHVSHVKFHNVGYAAVRIKGCLDALVEDCVFDDVFKRRYGYGVAIMEYSDRITIRDNFFVTRGRHGISTGTANNALPIAGYTKRVSVENNYFENFTDQAIDAHTETTGPYLVKGNVIVDSRVGINLRNGIAEIYDNVIIDCPTGILLRNDAVSAESIGSKVDRIVGNTIVNAVNGMQVDKTNFLIQDNVMQGANAGTGISLGPTTYSPEFAVISGNVLKNFENEF